MGRHQARNASRRRLARLVEARTAALVSALIQDSPDIDSDDIDRWVRSSYSLVISESVSSGEDQWDVFDYLVEELDVALQDGAIRRVSARGRRMIGDET